MTQPGYSAAVRACLALADAGDVPQALARCQAEISANPADGWAHDALGLIYCRNLVTNTHGSIMEGARQAFMRGLDCPNADPIFVAHLSALLVAIHQPPQALTMARAGLSLFGPLPKLRATEATCLARCYQGAAARAIFHEVLAAVPDDADLWEEYALAMRAAGLIDEAVVGFENALKRDPGKFKKLGMTFSNLLLAAGRNAEATETKARYLKHFGTPQSERANAAATAERTGDPAQVDAFWTQRLVSEAQDPEVYIEAVKSFTRIRMIPQALRALAQAAALPLGPELAAQKDALERAVVDYIPRVAALAATPPGAKRPISDDVIVVRGAVDALIAPVAKHYRAAHPGAFLILSTWANAEPAVLADVTPYFDDVVLNSRPKTAGVNNINFQLACAVNGVTRARDLGAQHIMVTRTDIALLRPNLLAELRRRLAAYPADPAKTPHLKQRLVVCDIFTQLVPFYHPSDLFCYGTAEDVAMFWSDAAEVNTCTGPEPFLCRKFAARAGRPLANHFQDSLMAIRDLFVVCDAAALQLYWQKNPFWPNACTLVERGLITEKIWSGQEKPLLKVAVDILPRAAVDHT